MSGQHSSTSWSRELANDLQTMAAAAVLYAQLRSPDWFNPLDQRLKSKVRCARVVDTVRFFRRQFHLDPARAEQNFHAGMYPDGFFQVLQAGARQPVECQDAPSAAKVLADAWASEIDAIEDKAHFDEVMHLIVSQAPSAAEFVKTTPPPRQMVRKTGLFGRK